MYEIIQPINISSGNMDTIMNTFILYEYNMSSKDVRSSMKQAMEGC
jgi:hypothetical protein